MENGEGNDKNPEANYMDKAGRKSRRNADIWDFPNEEGLEKQKGNTRETEIEDDSNEEMDVSFGGESSSTESQKDNKGDEGYEQTYYVPPLPNTLSDNTEEPDIEDESMSDITPREEE